MKPLVHFVLCVLLVAASGCLKVNQSLTINTDGSGIIDLKYAVSNQAVRQLEAMHKLQQQLALASGEQSVDDEETRYAHMFLMPNEGELRREIEKYESLGIKIGKLKVTTSGMWQNVEMKLQFDSLDKLAQARPFKYIGFDLVRNSQGHYVFYRASKPSEGYTPPDFSDPVTAKLLTPIFGGFSIRLSLKTPGRVLRTNAPRKSTYISEWTYDFERDPSVIARIQTAKQVTIFDSTGLNLPIIRH